MRPSGLPPPPSPHITFPLSRVVFSAQAGGIVSKIKAINATCAATEDQIASLKDRLAATPTASAISSELMGSICTRGSVYTCLTHMEVALSCGGFTLKQLSPSFVHAQVIAYPQPAQCVAPDTFCSQFAELLDISIRFGPSGALVSKKVCVTASLGVDSFEKASCRVWVLRVACGADALGAGVVRRSGAGCHAPRRPGSGALQPRQ